jgi:hypothetical protein
MTDDSLSSSLRHNQLRTPKIQNTRQQQVKDRVLLSSDGHVIATLQSEKSSETLRKQLVDFALAVVP